MQFLSYRKGAKRNRASRCVWDGGLGSAEKISDRDSEISIKIPPGFYFLIVANVKLDPIALQLGLDTIPTDTLILRCEAAN